MKIYRAEVSFPMLIAANSESEARQVAGDWAREALNQNDAHDCIELVTEVKALELGRDDLTSFPFTDYRVEEQRTVEQHLAEESNK